MHILKHLIGSVTSKQHFCFHFRNKLNSLKVTSALLITFYMLVQATVTSIIMNLCTISHKTWRQEDMVPVIL